MQFTWSSGIVVLASALPALAQTYTDCNPTEKTCPADVGLPSSSYTVDFTQGAGANASWSSAAGTTIEYGSDGAVFTIAESGQAPTIATDFFIFFGHVDVTMKAAAGTGIVSSIVLESATLDEIDWEFVGGDNTQVQSNFFGKGNTTSYDRVVYHTVSSPQDTWHTYGVDWTSERIEFSIDGSVVRTLPYSDSQTVNGKNYPQTPMQLKLGSWAGGDSSSEGTVEWAGGKTDYSQAPFKMYVKSVNITNYNPACEYSYSDLTGSFDSIDVITTGDSCSAGGTTSSSSASTAVQSGATSAPTISQVVKAIDKSIASVETVTGSSYSVNTASVSALNSGASTTAGTNATATGGPSSTSSIVESTGGASANSVMIAGSFLGVVLGAVFP